MVRVAVGENPKTGDTMYVMAQVESVEEYTRSDGSPHVYSISTGGVKTAKYGPLPGSTEMC
jgi:hypothetical protein